MENDDFIPTKGSSWKKNPLKDFQVVRYESYKPKKSKKVDVQEAEKETGKEVQLNMKRSKYEIIQFGMSGFDSKKKEEAKVQLAIKLGAKPPKNKYKNYKELLIERKKEADSKKAQTDFLQLGKNSIGKSTAKGKTFDKKRKKAKSDILDIYGTVKPNDIKQDLRKKRK